MQLLKTSFLFYILIMLFSNSLSFSFVFGEEERKNEGEPGMALEENKAVVRRHYEVGWNQKKLESVDETHAMDCIHHDPSNPVPIKGSEEIKKRLAMVMEAFPDIQFSILDMIAEQDKVVVYWQLTGTHQGVFVGIEPTGKTVKIQGIIIHRLENKKIVEDWVVRDTFGLMVQLGVITPPGGGQR